MKRQEFKNLIKESIKEVLIEEGVLSTIVSEVFKGAQLGQNIVREEIVPHPEKKEKAYEESRNRRAKAERTKIADTKKKMLEAIGQDSYNGVNLFDGTQPINKPGAPGTAETPSSPLAGINPGDPGVDISSLMDNIGAWKKMAK